MDNQELLNTYNNLVKVVDIKQFDYTDLINYRVELIKYLDNLRKKIKSYKSLINIFNIVDLICLINTLYLMSDNNKAYISGIFTLVMFLPTTVLSTYNNLLKKDSKETEEKINNIDKEIKARKLTVK